MVSVVLYFHAHQPFRIRNYTFFDIGENRDYFNNKLNKRILERVINKCYVPAGKLFLDLIEKYDVKVSYSISGVLIEQLEMWFPEVLDLYRTLVDTGNVELVCETYYHSLSFLYDMEEFKFQIRKHYKKIKDVFGVRPRVFRNTELAISNELAKVAEELGFDVVLGEGCEKILGWRSPTFLYKVKGTNIKILLRHYRLSDDIAFRFSCCYWKEYPLTADKFAKWINSHNGNGYVVNLFMDYETIGEHQWPETGIFEFFKYLPKYVIQNGDDFLTISEAAKRYPISDYVDIPYIISWADTERDLSAWLGDKIQNSAFREYVRVWNELKNTDDNELLETARKLSTSDHFYYMSLKYNADGDIHKYFREEAFLTPYDAYISYMNILKDIELRLKESKHKCHI